MKKIIVLLILLVSFGYSIKPTHFIDNEWRICDEYVSDKDGKTLYFKGFSGIEAWYDYDTNGNLTHTLWSDSTEDWFVYDDHNNIVEHNNGNFSMHFYYEYDKDGNVIHYRTSDGFEKWYKPGEFQNKNKKYIIDEEGNEYWYNDDSNIIYEKYVEGKEIFYDYYTIGRKRLKCRRYINELINH